MSNIVCKVKKTVLKTETFAEVVLLLNVEVDDVTAAKLGGYEPLSTDAKSFKN